MNLNHLKKRLYGILNDNLFLLDPVGDVHCMKVETVSEY